MIREDLYLLLFSNILENLYRIMGNIGGVKLKKTIFVPLKFCPLKFYKVGKKIARDFEMVCVENN